MHTTAVLSAIASSTWASTFSRTSVRRRVSFNSCRRRATPARLADSLNVANEPNTSPTNSATFAPAARAAPRSAITRVRTSSAASADSRIGTTTMIVINQSTVPMIAIAATANTITPRPSTISSTTRQEPSASSRTRLTVSLELRAAARAPGRAAIRRTRLPRTNPAARVDRSPQNQPPPKLAAARVTPTDASSTRISHGVMTSGASPARPS